MGKHGFFGGAFKGLDAFGKTLEDVKIKTGFGGILTLVSFTLIAALTLMEFVDYRRVHLHPSIVVDKSRGEKLVVHLNITFPRVPCYLLSVDIMDISGEHQNDIHHDILKNRLDKSGALVQATRDSTLKGELERAVGVKREPGYCGSCYGGAPGDSGCCNTCDEVRESYVRRGWSFVNPDGIDQCVREGFSEKIKEQSEEGCNVAGQVKVNKVIGNFHLSPGKSFQSNMHHVHDLVPYLAAGQQHDFGHIINRFSFAAEGDDGFNRETARLKQSLNIEDPLTGVRAHTEQSNYMFQYFVKVVSTKFKTLDGRTLSSHQYSVTQYERDLSKGNKPGKDEDGHQTSHGYAGVPGLFFNYEISPMLVVHREERQSFAHFITSTCAIVGGILTVAGLIDTLVYSSQTRLQAGGKSKEGLGFASASGRWL
ncbi:uncharacterized protein L969DRAFT_86871 [Mixia osmundae IAM 14324]|uniref:Endoplasmic reticulum vesicle transporter C-terminal domain-containing protein n=1 Tax=Mixia osmundae (strain CBS 9802 / IAM 14324 / JCM 22182 / KY 12970) TaxID=764103 RepID=G7E8Y7_MIXOS|nr:uncharacterized protein L969DRAFT_86871 [Mixia osmundae IAM 14324]KEI40240.1 hypothetical protein L969DRAFT_86871 [Mixia osmundae IAM 14324]GAA99605.1 hypothetical protein E5Q_06306 [Mixia osmundae IAM 14324]